MKAYRLVGLVATVSLFAACSEDEDLQNTPGGDKDAYGEVLFSDAPDFDSGVDTGTVVEDTGEPPIDVAPDTSTPPDSTLADTGTLIDTGTPIDSTVIDTGTPIDSTVVDSTVIDSTVIDSTVIDSTVIDSTVVDTSVIDSTVVDSGGPDTLIGDTGPFETGSVLDTEIDTSVAEDTDPLDTSMDTAELDTGTEPDTAMDTEPPSDSPGDTGAFGEATSIQSPGEAMRSARSHSITIDGVNDFMKDEAFATTSSGARAFITWDSANVYIGYQGHLSDEQTLNVYFDTGAGGARASESLGTQQLLMPAAFGGDHLFAIAGDGTQQIKSWSHGAWTPVSVKVESARAGDFVEVRIPFALFGAGMRFGVTAFVRERAPESIGSGLFTASFIDGYSPAGAPKTLARWLLIDRASPLSPNDPARRRE